MAHRIEVAFKPEFVDAAGDATAKRIAEDLGIKTDSVKTVDVYTVDSDIPRSELEQLSRSLFSDPIVQRYSIDRPAADKFDWLVEVGFEPGVTDNVGTTAREAVRDVIGKDCPVYTSRQYLFQGDVTRADVERIASDLLANDLIERCEIREYRANERRKAVRAHVPRFDEPNTIRVARVNLNVADDELIRLSRDGTLSLNLEEMRSIRSYRSELTDAELEMLAQTWSEHCKHKIFSGKVEYEDERGNIEVIDGVFGYIKRATEEVRKQRGKNDFCISVFKDNAGVIRLNDKYNVVFKVETHNTPSALDPYGGAITGIVGVNRDVMGTGKGARLLFNTDVFCFGDPGYSGELLSRMKHPKRVAKGVHKGVEHGGNKSGVPTVNGTIRFDERYVGKPLVYCGTGGIMPSLLGRRPSHDKKADAGDAVVMVGGRVGKDGIHGATFSSEALHKGSPSQAVQIGDPITQRKMYDMLLEARDRGYIKSITDNGAGGLSCSVGEMARESGGAEIDLAKVPLKYPGLQPWEILLSEAQERMTLAIGKRHLKSFLELAKRRAVEATIIGKYTKSGRFVARYSNENVADIELEFLHASPQKNLKGKWTPPQHEEPMFEQPYGLGQILREMLGRKNICSKESFVRQYDHEVQGGTVVKPFVGAANDGPSDAAVIWPVEMRHSGSYEGVVVSNGINPNYGDIDTYWMAASAVDEAVRNAIAVGADPNYVALLDNFCWSDPENPLRVAQLVRACRALYDFGVAYGTPYISGKDSMYNDYRGTDAAGRERKISVPPTLLISGLGKIHDVRRAVTMDLKEDGNSLYLLGVTKNELGASEYYSMMGEKLAGKKFIGRNVPTVDARAAKSTYEKIHEAIMNGYVRSCHDCSDGGLGVALAEMAIAGGYGMNVTLMRVPRSGVERDDNILFSESNGRLLVEVRPEHRRAFEHSMYGLSMDYIGRIGGDKLEIFGYGGMAAVSKPVAELKEAWQKPLRW